MIPALVFIAIAMLLGIALRASVPLFRWLYIPASVLAGAVGLLVIQLANHSESATLATSLESISQTLRGWPSWLIAVVFAGMMLERRSGSDRRAVRRVARQGLMVWIIVLGETAVGLLATWLLIQPFFDVPNSFGMLIETGFAGGHGTAAAMGQVYSHPSIDFAEGLDLGVLMATCGLIYGIVSGIVWINLAARLGWITPTASRTAASSTDLQVRHATPCKKIPSQLLWLTIAFAIGWLLQAGVQQAAGALDRLVDTPASVEQVAAEVGDVASQKKIVVGNGTPNDDDPLGSRLRPSQLLDFPLFIYTLFGGMIAHRLLIAVGQEHQLHPETISWLTGIAMDVLVVAAMASLSLAAVVKLLAPFSILLACGLVWTSICLLLLSRIILRRDDWFELGLINYGMSTGTTATGFVLLRVVDPHLKTNAASDYALAVPLSAPFIGGGILTIALPLLVLPHTSLAWPAIALTLIVIVLVLCGQKNSSAKRN